MDGDEITSRAFALAIGVPHQTALRWLLQWRAAGVAGIRLVPSRGRYGARYALAADLPRRYLAGRLPDLATRWVA